MKKNENANPAGSITVRRPDFGLGENFARHWFADNPILTHFMNSMHTIFPVGEQQFIKSIKVFDAAIRDETLRAQVKAFIGQEMQHTKQHQVFLDTLDRMGLGANLYADWYRHDAFMNDRKVSAEEFWLPLLKPFFRAGAEDRAMLAFTAALEHMTAVLADVMLENPALLEGMPENMKDLFLWHAVEEIEHKSVAFDVFTEAAGGSYAERMTGFVFAMYYLNYYLARGFFHFMMRDDKMDWLKLPSQLFVAAPFLFSLIGGIAVRVLPYAKRDFHPTEINNPALAHAMQAQFRWTEKKSA